MDLGFGASAVTALELWTRLVRVRPDVEVIGVEIDSDRVAKAREQLSAVRAGATPFDPGARVSFAVGGFEVPLLRKRRPVFVRAMNVLRQYDEGQVADAWALTSARLQPSGTLVEGTCDEIGRVCSWVDVDNTGAPQRLTVSLRLADLELPSIVAERLPKALIHRNVPGERVHAALTALDDAWTRAAPLGVFSPQQRWIAAVEALRGSGVPVLGGRTRWRLGELSLPWAAVAPL